MSSLSVDDCTLIINGNKENEYNENFGKNEKKKKNVSQLSVKNEEPFLQENPGRYVILPIEYPDIWKMYKKALASIWTAEEVDLSKDEDCWEDLELEEKHFISHILAFLISCVGVVSEILVGCLNEEVQVTEARCFFGYQIAMENVHSEMYSLLINTYIKDPIERKKWLNATETLPSVKKNSDWALNWISDCQATFAEQVVAFAAIERIFFSGSFASIFWFKKRGLMPGLTFSNDLISGDEALFCDFSCLIFNHLVNKPTTQRITHIISEAVILQKEFFTSSLSVELIGINSTSMNQHIESIADSLLLNLGCSKIYNIESPFNFIKQNSRVGKANFAVKEVEHQKCGIKTEKDEFCFTLDADF